MVFVVQGHGRGMEQIDERLQVQRVFHRRRSGERPWQVPLAWQLPMDVARQWARSLHRRIWQRPPHWGLCCRLPVEVLATFGVHDPSASVVQAARRSGKRSVLFLTSDQDVDETLDARSGGRSSVRCMHRYAITQADLVVAQTEYQQQVLRRRAERESVLIRNPIDTHLSSDDLLPLERRPYVLWVGRADRDCKRADRCVQLACECPGVSFLAVMNRREARDYDWLVQHAPRNLRILESVPWERSEQLFRGARAVINTSDSEGFPNTFLQAAKHGCPVISLSVDPDQVLARHRWGFCARGDMRGMAQMIRCLWQQPQRFRYVGQAARQYVVLHHDLVARVTQLSEVLQRLGQPTVQRRAA
jgi:glycosyltransferase involved in cell wall biosynthesis